MMWSCPLPLVSCLISISLAVKYPAFSFDTVPVYMHTCNTTGPFNDETMNFFKKFPIITFEKGQGVYSTQEPYASLYEEDKIIQSCQRIKAIKPDIICIMYLNTICDWPYYYRHELFAEKPEYWLRDDSGKIVLKSCDHSFPQPDQGMLVPDYRQTAVQEMWAKTCTDITTGNVYISPYISDAKYTYTHIYIH